MAFQGLDPIAFESVSAVTATPSIDVGVRRVYNGEEYVYVYNNGGAQASPGFGLVVSALSGYSVTVSSTSGQFAVGFVKHATLTTATYGWALVRGFLDGMTNGMASTALAAGDALQIAADGKVCKGETGPYIAAAMKATASAGTMSAFIRCFG
jgi:hypothetical protein